MLVDHLYMTGKVRLWLPNACRKGSTKVSCLMRDEKLNAPFHGLAALSQAPDNVPCKDKVKVAVLIALWEPGCGIASSFFLEVARCQHASSSPT